MTISAVILTKNEENNIKDCLGSLNFCDELIVIDDNSIDKTTELAKKMGAKVYSRNMNMDFSVQSNFGMKKATGNWILFVDADERISPILTKEIRRKTKNIPKKVNGFEFRRIDFMWDKWLKHGDVGEFKSIRLVRKNSGFWVRRVHPYFEIKGETRELKHPILHYPHKNLNKFIESINRWSTWHAFANSEEAKRSNLFKVLCYPPAHFIRNYILRLGFLDGMPGFVFSAVMAGHSYLAWAKLFVLQKMEKEP